MNSFDIKLLPKEQWKGVAVPITYTTEEYYDVKKTDNGNGFTVSFTKKRFEFPVTHSPEEYDFPDRLYADWWEDAEAWGIAENGELRAVIELCPEGWSNRLRVTELWVAPELRKKGVGHALMDTAKKVAREQNRRAIILETQSCNINAIGFYLHEGFSLIGFDLCAYSNRDTERREVRLEMGMMMREDTK